MNYDEKCREDFKSNPSSCIAWYLMASYAYYKENESLLSDSTFDKMCLYILTNWTTLEHRYKHLVNKESLTAGTGFDVEWNRFPEGFMRTIYSLMEKMK